MTSAGAGAASVSTQAPQPSTKKTAARPQRKDRDRVVAGAGGIGGGSIFLLLADQFPINTLWHQLLTYIAPWATALGTAGWLYLQGEFIIKWQFKKSLSESKRIIERDLANTTISAAEKGELEEQLKDLRELEREFYLKRIRVEPG
jgi:hypothetical protein